jgi:hypothetical protein
MKRTRDIGNREIIGIVKYKQKLIQRKLDGDVIWETITKDTPVTNKDSIRTADDSLADIELNNKTDIQLSENSMVVLDFSNEKIDIDFAYGAMSAKNFSNDSNQTVNIKSEDKTIALGKSDINLSKTSEKNLNFQMEKGQAVIKTNEGEKKIEQDQVVNISKDKLVIKKISTKLLSPSNLQVFESNSELITIPFHWEIDGEISSIILEVFKDSKLQKKVKSVSLKKEKSIEMKLSPSTYFWRVVSKTNQGEEAVSSLNSFLITKEEKLSFISPDQNSQFSFTQKSPLVLFSWTKLESARSYLLEISTNKDFSKIIYSSDILNTRIGIDTLSEGNYFARLSSKPSVEYLRSQNSSVLNFKIEKKNSLEATEIITPPNQVVSLNSTERSNFVINWKQNPEFKSYEVEVSKESDFKTKEVYKTNTNYIAPKLSEKGTYYYRVSGVTKEGIRSDSKTSSFVVKESINLEMNSPKNNSEILISKNEPLIFKWNKLDIYGKYILDISLDSDFNQIIKSKETSSTSTSVDGIIAGKFFSRVRFIQDGKEEIAKSSIISFTIPKIYSEPKLIFPIQEKVVDISNMDKLKFEWEEVINADYYSFELLDKNEKVFLKEKTKSNQFIIKDFKILDEGKFYWKLNAHLITKDNKDFFTPQASESFVLKLSANTKDAPKLLSNKKQHVDKK